MKLALKSLSVDKGDVRYEVHAADCPDNQKNDPIQVFISEKYADPEAFVTADMEDDIPRSSYRVMPCTKSLAP